MAYRRSVRIAAREAMQKFNYDPLDVLVQFAQLETTNQDTKLEIAQTLLPYMYPKLSNVTMDAEVSVNERSDNQAALLRRILENPELADAAQRLSIAAAEASLELDSSSVGGMIQ
jgi:hypothetical protein